MNRLVTRLVISHLAVAAVAGLTTFLLVRGLAPQLFDRQTHGMPGGGSGRGRALREQFAVAVDESLLIGVLVGLLVAALLGVLAAYRLSRPLTALGASTRDLARGRYAVEVPSPGTRELDALAADVRTLASTLQETEARRTRLLGEVAHEMRTPLTVIDGYVEGMIDGVLPTDDESLARLQAETRRLRRLSNDLSALSRAEEGRLGLRLTECDLGQVARAAAERLRPQAEDADVALQVEAGPPIPVTADPDRVAQVVTNLVGNALRATPAGGRIVVGADAGDGVGVVRVSDTGEGLAREDLDRVFERFYRVPGRRRGEGSGDDGSGIGLTISRGIAEAHGGSLEATSAGRGQGSTFTLSLPLGARRV